MRYSGHGHASEAGAMPGETPQPSDAVTTQPGPPSAQKPGPPTFALCIYVYINTKFMYVYTHPLAGTLRKSGNGLGLAAWGSCRERGRDRGF